MLDPELSLTIRSLQEKKYLTDERTISSFQYPKQVSFDSERRVFSHDMYQGR